jgi:anti-sigma regulatory factor (Ser/Thr protein kinase)
MQPTTFFELNFASNVQLVSVVRQFATEFYQRFLSDPDGTSRVSLATDGLLENAVKYSKDGDMTIRIEVEQTKPKIVRIVLRNRAELANLAAIREALDGICAEGEMTVTYKVLEDDTSEIVATTSMGERN